MVPSIIRCAVWGYDRELCSALCVCVREREAVGRSKVMLQCHIISVCACACVRACVRVCVCVREKDGIIMRIIMG